MVNLIKISETIYKVKEVKNLFIGEKWLPLHLLYSTSILQYIIHFYLLDEVCPNTVSEWYIC